MNIERICMVYISIYIYKNPPTSPRASSVLDSTSLPSTSSPFPTPNPRRKGQKRTSVQPVHVARQLESSNPTLRAARQLESRISGARMLKSRDLSILSSSVGDLLGCNSLPQAATRCQTSGPFPALGPQICAPASTETKGLEGRPKGRKGVAMDPKGAQM